MHVSAVLLRYTTGASNCNEYVFLRLRRIPNQVPTDNTTSTDYLNLFQQFLYDEFTSSDVNLKSPQNYAQANQCSLFGMWPA